MFGDSERMTLLLHLISLLSIGIQGAVQGGRSGGVSMDRRCRLSRAAKVIKLGISNTGSINWLRAMTGWSGNKTTAAHHPPRVG